jgi:hypothetical protein
MRFWVRNFACAPSLRSPIRAVRVTGGAGSDLHVRVAVNDSSGAPPTSRTRGARGIGHPDFSTPADLRQRAAGATVALYRSAVSVASKPRLSAIAVGSRVPW